MKTKMFILFLVLLVPNGEVFLQEIPDCWCSSKLNEIITGDTTLYGEWALDTCDIGIEGNCKDLLLGMLTNPSSTVNYNDRLFAKTRFEIWVDTIVISRSSSTLTSFTWDDIDNTFMEIKQGLEGLKNNFGEYSLIPISTWDNDSISNSQIFRLEFENFVNIEEVLDFLYHINDSLSGNLYLHSKYEWVYEIANIDENQHQKATNIIITPNPVTDRININFEWALSGIIELKIFDIQGNELVFKSITCHLGNNIINLDFAKYPSGVYFVVVNDGNEVRKQMFVKE